MSQTIDRPRSQSAVIPYRKTKGGKLEVLLITSRETGRWVPPKGMIEPDMTAWESAAKEALEEAGIEGRVSEDCLGTYHYVKPEEGACSVQVFAMEVGVIHDDWLEAGERQRQWMSPKKAARSVDEAELGKILLALRKSLG